MAVKKVKLSISDKCVDYLAKIGYSREFGARNINRLVDEKIATPLADEVLFGKLSSGGSVRAELSCENQKTMQNPDVPIQIEFVYK